MSSEHLDADLDALAPIPKRVRLAGKDWKLPGDLPMELFFRVQGYEQRVADGANEYEILQELQGEILELFREHQPKLEKLPPIGLRQLLALIGQVYGGQEPPGEALPPNRAARRSRTTRTPSSTHPSRAPAT